ncbi:MAG: SEC-C metal-binding domain-containing protein [Defluviitaleaceae bacterium]|nr:SEC-C metal-binding domain-containing protein [Defluviitaleaceae bacterium]
MGVYKDWLSAAYDERGGLVSRTWDAYLPLEQAIYEKMLANKDNTIKGTLSELAEKHSMSLEQCIGFLDGISGAMDEVPDFESFDADSMVDVTIDFETLYKKMVEYKADHLWTLPEWESVFSADERKAMYKEQKASGTVIVGEKTGRNDPCPCESGKKYKKCCG